MQVANLIVWDLETGGLKPGKAAMCEIAMIAYNSETLEEVDRYEAIIAPYKNLDGEDLEYQPAALQYNGLSMSQINAGKDAKIVAKEIEAFAKKHNKKMRGGVGKPISVGHNIVKFDIPHLISFLEIFKVDYNTLFQEWSIDTLWITRMAFPVDGSIANHKLGTACESMGIELVDAHRAMKDVESNGQLVVEYLKRLRNEGGTTATIEKKQDRYRDTFQF